ncbi:MAG: SHOCT domain-containing protein [Nanoarchaeota archaeon]
MAYTMWDMMYGLGYSGMLFMIIFWAAIIWLIVWIVREVTKGKESASELLEKRYIKGDITKKQYQDMKKTLRR